VNLQIFSAGAIQTSSLEMPGLFILWTGLSFQCFLALSSLQWNLHSKNLLSR